MHIRLWMMYLWSDSLHDSDCNGQEMKIPRLRQASFDGVVMCFFDLIFQKGRKAERFELASHRRASWKNYIYILSWSKRWFAKKLYTCGIRVNDLQIGLKRRVRMLLLRRHKQKSSNEIVTRSSRGVDKGYFAWYHLPAYKECARDKLVDRTTTCPFGVRCQSLTDGFDLMHFLHLSVTMGAFVFSE